MEYPHREKSPAPPDAAHADLWWIPLCLSGARLAHYAATLSIEEQNRAGKFVFEPDRARFIAGRGALREILSRYLSAKASHLSFAYNAYGKPCLPAAGDLRFNFSHAGGHALLAVTRDAGIGVDLEKPRPLPDLRGIVEIICSEPEKRLLTALPEAEREQAFWRLWTAKEALLKGEGTGFSSPPSGVDCLPLIQGDTARLTREGRPWTLQRLPSRGGYIATIALQTGRLLLLREEIAE